MSLSTVDTIMGSYCEDRTDKQFRILILSDIDVEDGEEEEEGDVTGAGMLGRVEGREEVAGGVDDVTTALTEVL